ncbi:MAG: hypothetical protein HUU38_32460, partial [Anaerolineales bacterium]|nr:hypothetical protein [Anaerolineales bacterium]NUM49438.1 hypothetical protein [Anaerolineales bacterium]
MDKLGKVMTINLRHRAGHPPGEFAEGFPPELVRLPPAETPRGGRSWRGKLGWGVVFLLLLML